MLQIVTKKNQNLASLNRTTNLDSSPETSPSAPSISSPSESSVPNTTSTSNVTPVTPSKRPRPHIITISPTPSSHITSTHISRPPIPEIPYTPRSRSQPSIHTPISHIPHPHTVAHLVNYKQPTAIKTARVSTNLPSKLDIVQIPDIEYTPLPSLHLPAESASPSQVYPPLKPLRHPSTSLTNLLDSASEYHPQTDTSSSEIIPQHRYKLRPQPNRRLSATDSSTLNFSALSINSALRLLRQHAQPISSDTVHSSDFAPQSHLTSGLDTASLHSSDVQTVYLSGNLRPLSLL